MTFDTFPSPESHPNLRDEAINAYKKFIELNITSPDDLDLDDPEVKVANELFFKWQADIDAQAEGDTLKKHEANFAKTTFYVDAGFTDPSYLQDVLGWLDQDLENAEEGEDEPLTEMAAKIKAKMHEIEKMIGIE